MIKTLVAVALLALAVVAFERETNAVEPVTCDWDAEFTRTVAELGEDLRDWAAVDTVGESGGHANLDDLTVTVNPNFPCDMVSSVVRHEWAHLQQGRIHGSWNDVAKRYGSNMRAERVADCASKLLGSTVTLYLDPTHDYYAGPCTDQDMVDAQYLIDFDPSGKDAL